MFMGKFIILINRFILRGYKILIGLKLFRLKMEMNIQEIFK